MNKADLTERLQLSGHPRFAQSYINILTRPFRKPSCEREKVTISDFGTFTVSKRLHGPQPQERSNDSGSRSSDPRR